MLLRTALFLTICLIFPVNSSAQASTCKDDNTQRNCCGVTRIEDCPVTGCGGDSELNRRKNRTSKPAAADVEQKTLKQIAAFTSPASWDTGTKRTLLKQWGEGKAVEVKAFIIDAENYTQGAESTNCHLGTNDYNDFHIVLVENPSAAKKAAVKMDSDIESVKKAGKKAFKRAEKKSLTAEISPRLRLDGWTIEKLRKLARDFAYVRVTGWVMLDTQHISHPINRISNWEIHPVTKFEVCTATVAECDAGTGWTTLEDVP